MTNAILWGKPDVGNPHVRFEVGGSRIGKPRRGSLLYTNAILISAKLRANFVKVAVSLVLTLFSNALFAQVIQWRGAVSDAWELPENWNLQRVPTSADTVDFPDLGKDYTIAINGNYEIAELTISTCTTTRKTTLSGLGSLRVKKTGENKINLRHGLILSGVTLNYDGYLMLYNGVSIEVRESSALIVNSSTGLYLYREGAVLIVNGGSVELNGPLRCNADCATALELKSGLLSVPNLVLFEATKDNIYEGTSVLTVFGGTLSVDQFDVNNSMQTLHQTGGRIRIAKGYNLMGGVMDLTGGVIELTYDFSDTSVFSLVNGTKVVSPTANLLAVSPEPVTVKGPLEVAGLKNGNVSDAIFSIDTVVFSGGESNPFDFQDGASPYFVIEGPATWRSKADMDSASADVVVGIKGSVVADTRDWVDVSVARTMRICGLSSYEGSASLSVTGGGTLKATPVNRAESYSAITIEENTTFELVAPQEVGPIVGHLKCESFSLGSGATLKIVAGENFVESANWSIAPAAKIVVTVPVAFSEGAYAILQDMESKDLPDAWLDQIELVNAPTGVKIKNDHGQITLFKRTNDLGKWGDWEWTGADSSGSPNWSQVGNWQCGKDMPEKTAVIFGASSVTNSYFDGKLIRSTDGLAKGTTGGNIVFQTNAVDSFTVNGVQMTFSRSDAITSYSSVPQRMGIPPRFTGGSQRTIWACGDAPVVLSGPFYYNSTPAISFSGDIRLAGGDVSFPKIKLDTATGKSGGTWLSILSGVTCTANDQNMLYGLGCGIRIATGGSLVFDQGSETSVFQISRNQHSHVVNGLLDIRVPFCGGSESGPFRHVFRGTGRMNISSIVPKAANTRIVFADTLQVYMTNDWTTATAESKGFSASVRGAPTFHVKDGWSYGHIATLGNLTTKANRRLEIEKGAILSIDAAGGSVSFVDAFVGPGTLALTNATLAMTGAFETDAAIRLDGGSVLDVTENQVVGGLSADGGVLKVADGRLLSVVGNVDVRGMSFAGLSTVWKSYINVSGDVAGIAERKDIRLRVSNGVLQAKNICGLVLVVR